MNEDLPVPVEPITSKELDPLKDVKAKLTSEEKERFFKAFLADKAFIDEQTLFNGKLKVKFTSLNIKQNNSIMLQMQTDREKGIAQNNDAYLIKVIQYRLAASILELDNKPFAENITEESHPFKDGSTYIAERLKLMETWPLYKISSLTDAFNKFERKLRALTEESFNEDF